MDSPPLTIALAALLVWMLQPITIDTGGYTHVVSVEATFVITNNGDVEVDALALGLVKPLLAPINADLYGDTQRVIEHLVFIDGADSAEPNQNPVAPVKPGASVNITLRIAAAVDLEGRRRGLETALTGSSTTTETGLYGGLTEPEASWNYTHPVIALLARYLEETAPNPSPVSKLEAVLGYLDRNIVYSISIIPRQPWEVVIEGMGDCDDQSRLAVALLRSMGIPSSVEVGFVYVSENYWLRVSRRGLSAEYTFRGGFSHAWVLAYVDELGWIRIDPTARLAGGGDPWVMVRHAYYYKFPTLALGLISGEDDSYVWFMNLNELSVKKLYVNATVTVRSYPSSSRASS